MRVKVGEKRGKGEGEEGRGKGWGRRKIGRERKDKLSKQGCGMAGWDGPGFPAEPSVTQSLSPSLVSDSTSKTGSLCLFFVQALM